MKGFKISSNREDMDLSLIHQVISGSYWAKGIPLETLRRALDNSLCFGIFTEAGPQVGFARVISDSATFAYLADVFVVEDFKGRGLSKWLMETVIAHPTLQGLRRFVLATLDAHGLYKQYGFKPLAHPDIFMERWVPDIYTRTEP